MGFEDLRRSRRWRLLRLGLPSWYRHRYADELLRLHWERARTDRRMRPWGMWGRIVWDVALTAIETRISLGRGTTKRRGWAMGGFESGLPALRLALRSLMRKPAHTATAVLTLGVGIGVTAAVATVVHTVVLAPTPYGNADEIIQISRLGENGRMQSMLRPADVSAIEEGLGESVHMGVARFRDVAIATDGAPVRVRGVVTTAATFAMLGTPAALGRLPTLDDDVPGGPCLALASWTVWRDHFDGSTDVLDRAVRLDGRPCRIIGIMPEGFRFPRPYFAPGDLWLLAGPEQVDWTEGAGAAGFLTFGRVAAGQRAPVDAALRVISDRSSGSDRYVATRWAANSREGSRNRLTLILWASALVLLLACVNVIMLQTARMVDRRAEFGTRRALGATRSALGRIVLAETTILAALGLVVGVGVAALALQMLVAVETFLIPRMDQVSFDGFTLVACVVLGAAAAAVAGVPPALGVVRSSAEHRGFGSDRRFAGGRGQRRFGSVLVGAEALLALILLAGAMLMVRNYQGLADLDPGFQTEDMLHVRMTPAPVRYGDAAHRAAYYARVIESIQAAPEVKSATMVWVPPGIGAGPDRYVSVDRAGTDAPARDRTVWRPVHRNHFAVLGTPTVRGSSLAEAADAAEAVVVNEAFVAHFMRGQDPVGALVRGYDSAEATEPMNGPWTIVGVVPDVHEGFAYVEPPPAVYVPIEMDPPHSVAILARTRGEPLAAGGAVAEAVARVDPEQPVHGVREYDFLLRSEFDLNRLAITLLGVFALGALVLVVAGVYGVVSHAVGRRIREMGIRIALGADGRHIQWLVVRDAALHAVLGVGGGSVVVALFGRRLAALAPAWVGVAPTLVLTAAAAVVLIAIVAAAIPGRRAAKTDPMESLGAQ